MDIDDINEDNLQEKLQELRDEFEKIQSTTKSKTDFPVEIPNYEDLISISDNVIFVELNMNLVSNIGKDGTEPGHNTQIYNNNYYIPVPTGQNTEDYIKGFIQHFEKTLAQTTKENDK